MLKASITSMTSSQSIGVCHLATNQRIFCWEVKNTNEWGGTVLQQIAAQSTGKPDFIRTFLLRGGGGLPCLLLCHKNCKVVGQVMIWKQPVKMTPCCQCGSSRLTDSPKENSHPCWEIWVYHNFCSTKMGVVNWPPPQQKGLYFRAL